MSKDARLTIRIDDELDRWLGEQGAANGLDKATFARMLLFRAKNGQAELEAKALNPLMAATPAEIVNRALERVEPIPAQAAEVDIDALVAQRLAAAGEGRAASRALDPDPPDPVMQELGMRPHRIAPAPHFGDKSPRITRASTWAPAGASRY